MTEYTSTPDGLYRTKSTGRLARITNFEAEILSITYWGSTIMSYEVYVGYKGEEVVEEIEVEYWELGFWNWFFHVRQQFDDWSIRLYANETDDFKPALIACSNPTIYHDDDLHSSLEIRRRYKGRLAYCVPGNCWYYRHSVNNAWKARSEEWLRNWITKVSRPTAKACGRPTDVDGVIEWLKVERELRCNNACDVLCQMAG